MPTNLCIVFDAQPVPVVHYRLSDLSTGLDDEGATPANDGAVDGADSANIFADSLRITPLKHARARLSLEGLIAKKRITSGNSVAGFPTGSSPRTMMVWVKRMRNDARSQFGYGHSDNAGTLFAVDSGSPSGYAVSANTPEYEYTGTKYVGKWEHVAVTYHRWALGICACCNSILFLFGRLLTLLLFSTVSLYNTRQ